MAQWKEITTSEEWQKLKSSEKPVVILKHSTTCPVSSNALNEFEQYLDNKPREDAEYIMVKVIESRPVSNQIAEDTGIKHASPQILYLDKGQTVWNASHWSITSEHMEAVLND